MKKRLAVIITVAIAVCVSIALIGSVGTGAWFSDQETSTGNTLTAGTLDLQVDGKDDPLIETITVTDMKPGDTYTHVWKVRNIGSIPGKVTIKITSIVSDDNGCNDPEEAAEIGEYGSASPGAGEGELPRFIRTQVFKSHVNVESPIGWGINDYHSHNLTGRNPSGSPTGGMIYIEDLTMDGQVLGENEFHMVKIVLKLDSDVINDGAGWWTGHDVDDNILQSDDVTFDVVFDLEQVH